MSWPAAVPIAPATESPRPLIHREPESLSPVYRRALLAHHLPAVQTAGDGAEAIALFEKAKACGRGFDAVLLDLTVSGGMGGLEAAARLKELDSSIKLIVSSGYSDAPVLSDLRKYGFDDSIPKPWTVARVSEVIRRVLVSDFNRNA